MRRRKNYIARAKSETPGEASIYDRNVRPVFTISAPAIGLRRIDYSQWMELGLERWVWAWMDTLEAMRQSGTVAASTLLNYAGCGARRWFDFLREQPQTIPPSKLRADHVAALIVWLKIKYPSRTGGETIYGHIKAVLVAMCELGYIHQEVHELFPRQPFGRRRTDRQIGATILTHREIGRLAAALKSDLIAIHNGSASFPESERLTISFVVVSLRTGINLTPLLEAKRDCLTANPLVPNMMLLHTVKRRRRADQEQAVPDRAISDTDTDTVPMDVVGILNLQLKRSEELVAEADPSISGFLWLYRSNSRRCLGKVSLLNGSIVNSSIRNFVRRHGLQSDDGKPLRPTSQSLRKTMESKLWHLSDGDLTAVAAAMGHTPNVADQHYLQLSADMKAEAANFVGLALPEILRGNDSLPTPSIPMSIQGTIQATPSGRCADARHGKLAPKDGTRSCDRFTDCIVCPSFVVVGSLSDLHRLFSFQEFMRYEIDYMASSDMEGWRVQRQQLIKLIDGFTESRFAKSLLEKAKEMAKTSPHPFWAARMRRVTSHAGD